MDEGDNELTRHGTLLRTIRHVEQVKGKHKSSLACGEVSVLDFAAKDLGLAWNENIRGDAICTIVSDDDTGLPSCVAP